MIRLLSDVLVDVAEAILPDSAGIVLVESAHLDLPFEFQLAKRGGVYELHADIPRWRWKTGFDPVPGRIVFELKREVLP